MERNQVIGLLLIFLMLTVYFQYYVPAETPPVEKKGITTDSLSKKDKVQAEVSEETKKERIIEDFAELAPLAVGTDQELVLENKDLKITFGTKGGQIKSVELKKYKNTVKKPVILLDEQSSQRSLKIQTTESKTIDLFQLYFITEAPIVDEKTNSIRFRLALDSNRMVIQEYSLKPEGFQLDYNIKMEGIASSAFSPNAQFLWQDKIKPQEPDLEQERLKSTVNYYTATGNYNYLGETTMDPVDKKLDEAVHWFSYKQKFFNAAFIAKNKNIKSAFFQQSTNPADLQTVKSVTALASISLADLENGKGAFQYYFGPNRYEILNKVTEGFYENVDLGWPVVEWVTMFLVIPLFNLLEGLTSNYGVIITLLVLIVKALLFPLSYRSYISMAKMKVLKPEIDEIKAQAGDDMQKVQQEQMKLYSQMGINPLAGCIPLLLQLPVLFAMFTFFPNAIELRQESFLWALDLSHYDSIATLPFPIPFYGSHVSLFTILMTISTIGITYINNQNTPNLQDSMKYMGYFMPVVFMFILNTLPAGLSYYYLLSNVVSMAQQITIRRFVDEKKIRETLEANKIKNKNKPKTGFMQRLEQTLKAQQEQKTQKQQAKNNKK